MKYKYVLLIATSYYKKTIVDSINKVILKSESLTVVVVLNSDNNHLLFKKYTESFNSDCCKVLISPQKGKSSALNFYLKSIDDQDVFIIFTDDDIVFPSETINKYMVNVEKIGKGFFYGGGVDVFIEKHPPEELYSFYPDSIKGLSEQVLLTKKQFLGCNWGAFATDLINAGYFNPLYGPGSITRATGQERVMMNRLLAMGVKPVAIMNARVIHIAPKDCITPEWLLERRLRNSIKYGLQKPYMLPLSISKKIGKVLLSKGIRRMIAYSELLGLLISVKYIFLPRKNLLRQ